MTVAEQLDTIAARLDDLEATLAALTDAALGLALDLHAITDHQETR